VPIVLIGLYLIFAHGCHRGDHDVDDELSVMIDGQSQAGMRTLGVPETDSPS
jgi:hypothetical protein